MTGDGLRRITAAIGEILPGRILTREELTAEIVTAVKSPGIEPAIQSGWGPATVRHHTPTSQMFKPAAAGGLLCSGPARGRNVTFTSPRTWVPDAPWDEQPDADSAMATVVTRFLDSYGPATHTASSMAW